MSRWFRHYAGMMRDEKLVRAAMRASQPVERVVWVWGAILESAAEINDAGRYDLEPAEAAYFLRCGTDDVCAILAALEALGRLRDGTVVRWNDRQYISDNSTERVRKHRQDRSKTDVQRRSNGSINNSNADETLHPVTVTPPETETETETEIDRLPASESCRAKARGARITQDFVPHQNVRELGRSRNLTDAEIDDEFEKMRDHFSAKTGKDATKLDWNAAARNWIKRAADDKRRYNRMGVSHEAGRKNTIADGFAKVDAVIDELERRERTSGFADGKEDPRIIS